MSKQTGDKRLPWVALNMVAGLDPEVLAALVDIFGSAADVISAGRNALQQCPLLTPAPRKKLMELNGDLSVAEQELKRAEVAGVKIVTRDCPGYPEPLVNVPGAPPVLYIQGDYTGVDVQAVAIVGTRKCTGYGRDMARHLARGLVRNGFTVVSGLAHGVDSAAHQGALQGGGRTIAVMGAGLSSIYPAGNSGLAREAAQNGALISEFSMETGPDKWNFPRRNRVISGLCLGVVVVQAPERSGALITAQFAVEQGREVFAVPGDVNHQLSRGPHQLIRDGACLVESVDDILDALNLAPAQTELNFTPKLSADEERILSAIGGEPTLFDDVCRNSGCDASRASTLLTMLEMKGLVRQLPGKLFVKQA